MVRLMRLVHLAWVLALTLMMPLSNALAEEGSVCAKVRIEISQELAFVRQAFDARMKISNTLDSRTLDNVRVTVKFNDDDGNPVAVTSDPNQTSALFYYRVDSLSGISDVSGTGTVQPSSQAEIHWLIIPSANAATLLQGARYFIGATLNFDLGGEAQEIEVAPDFVTVKPQPELELDYFLTSEVRSDDSFTPAIEPAEPFVLGVRVQNTGLGLAQNVSINSAQPRIIDNQQGLLIGFEITGSFVDEQEVEPTLLMNFGDMPSDTARIGRWVMETSLSGRFTDFTARFRHADELGGLVTSLLKRVSAHLLINDVMVDAPGRDSISDFLASDGALLTAYESEGLNTPVVDYSSQGTLTFYAANGDTTTYKLDLPYESGLLYFKSTDPFAGSKDIISVTRSDGKQLKLKNAWTSAEGNGTSTNRFFNLFDANSPGHYTIVFGPKAVGPQSPVLQFIADRNVSAGDRVTFIVQASNPDSTVPLLSIDAKPTGSTFIDYGNGTGQFDWQTNLGQAGTFPLTFRATSGALSAARSMTIRVGADLDSDHDGIPDSWELAHFGTLNRDGTGDFDGDGITDKEEFDQGTDPNTADGEPTKPIISAPLVGASVGELSPILTVQNSARAGNTPIYEFAIYSDERYSDLVATQIVPQNPGSTSWPVPQQLQDNTNYYWRARVSVQNRSSEWAYGEFFVNTANDAPTGLLISTPKDGKEVDTLTPRLEVSNAIDKDNDPLRYSFEVVTDLATMDPVASVQNVLRGSSGTTSWRVQPALFDHDSYYWRATATDEHGATAVTPWTKLFTNTSNHAPTVPVVVDPINGKQITASAVNLISHASTDLDNGALRYYIELDTSPSFNTSSGLSLGPLPSVNHQVSAPVTGLLDNTTYYWRIRSVEYVGAPVPTPTIPDIGIMEAPAKMDLGQGGGGAKSPPATVLKTVGQSAESEWAVSSFMVNMANDRPSVPTVRNPSLGAWVGGYGPTLEVNTSKDVDLDALTYNFQLFSDNGLTHLLGSFESPLPSWNISNLLISNSGPSGAGAVAPAIANRTRYYWRARVVDSHGLTSQDWTSARSFYVAADQIADPPILTFKNPASPVSIGNWSYITIRWDDTDPDSNAMITLKVGDTVILNNREEDPDGGKADSFLWNPQGLAPGTYPLSADIFDGTTLVTVTGSVITIIDEPMPVPSNQDLNSGQFCTQANRADSGAQSGLGAGC